MGRRRTTLGKGRMEDEDWRVKLRMIGKRRMEFGNNRTDMGKSRMKGKRGGGRWRWGRGGSMVNDESVSPLAVQRPVVMIAHCVLCDANAGLFHRSAHTTTRTCRQNSPGEVSLVLP